MSVDYNTGAQIVALANGLPSDYPNGATPLVNSSGVSAAATASATLGAASGRTTYLSSIKVNSLGATGAAAANISVLGVSAATVTVPYATVAGVTVANTPLSLDFKPAVPATAANTSISVQVPSLGSGNTAAVVTLTGYQI